MASTNSFENNMNLDPSSEKKRELTSETKKKMKEFLEKQPLTSFNVWNHGSLTQEKILMCVDELIDDNGKTNDTAVYFTEAKSVVRRYFKIELSLLENQITKLVSKKEEIDKILSDLQQ